MVTHKSTRDLVKLFSPQNVVSHVEQVHPNRDWPPIWALVFHPLLCNSLKSFSWRSTHNVLPTRSKLLKWRLGDGGGSILGHVGDKFTCFLGVRLRLWYFNLG